jgi:hypothetical protein
MRKPWFVRLTWVAAIITVSACSEPSSDYSRKEARAPTEPSPAFPATSSEAVADTAIETNIETTTFPAGMQGAESPIEVAGAQDHEHGDTNFQGVAGTRGSTRCLVELSQCSNGRTTGKLHEDNWEGAASNLSRCLRRAGEYAAWCENTNRGSVSVKFLVNNRVVGSARSN